MYIVEDSVDVIFMIFLKDCLILLIFFRLRLFFSKGHYILEKCLIFLIDWFPKLLEFFFREMQLIVI
jgi:hypothetical protein